MAEIGAFPDDWDSEARKAWFAERLEGLSREGRILVIARAGLREAIRLLAFLEPLNVEDDPGKRPKLLVGLLRCLPTMLAAAIVPANEQNRFAAAITAARFSVVATAAAAADTIAAGALDNSVSARAAAFARLAGAAASTTPEETARFAASSGLAANQVFWDDCVVLRKGVSLAAVAIAPLWPEAMLGEARTDWSNFALKLRALGDDWDIWAEWYETLLPGAKEGRFLFGIKTKRALELLLDVVLSPLKFRTLPPGLNAR